MTTYQIVPADMTAASGRAADAGSDARGADGSSALEAVAAALPGSSTAVSYPDLADTFSTGVSGWAGDVESFSDSVAAANDDATTTDGASGSWFDRLLGAAGGHR